MSKIIGLAAVMIYARRPEELAHWYQRYLGLETALNLEDNCYYGDIHDEASGHIIHFGIFPDDNRKASDNGPIMINYQVENLSRFISHLQANGVKVEKTLDTEFGSFAYIRDAEGNPIEIWEAPNSSK